MHWLSLGMAALLALAIIVIGILYLTNPKIIVPNFGLPLPEAGANIPWWLRLKGVRDITAGLNVLAFLVWGAPWTVGLVLLVETCIPVGDMTMVLAAKGSAAKALGIHGVTATIMVLTGVALIMGAR